MITGRIDYGIQFSHCNCNKIYVIYLFYINGLTIGRRLIKRPLSYLMCVYAQGITFTIQLHIHETCQVNRQELEKSD